MESEPEKKRNEPQNYRPPIMLPFRPTPVRRITVTRVLFLFRLRKNAVQSLVEPPNPVADKKQSEVILFPLCASCPDVCLIRSPHRMGLTRGRRVHLHLLHVRCERFPSRCANLCLCSVLLSACHRCSASCPRDACPLRVVRSLGRANQTYRVPLGTTFRSLARNVLLMLAEFSLRPTTQQISRARRAW